MNTTETAYDSQPSRFTNVSGVSGVSSLSEDHRRELVEGSGIDPRIIAERTYATISAADARAKGFDKSQATDGLLVPLYSPLGGKLHQLKPDKPRLDRKEKKRGKTKRIKYETPAGAEAVIDVHPSNYRRLLDTYDPIYVPEGVKKADCLTSRGRLTVALIGVWMWGKKREHGGSKYGRPELLPDWDVIPLEGRRVYISFDADFREKVGVALAMFRLAERLTERGAHVYIMVLPGPEKGIDDYIVAGGDLDTLERDARPFDRSGFIRHAAKRDACLSRHIDRMYYGMKLDDWTGKGEAGANHMTHSLLRAFLELASLTGRYDKDTNTVSFVCGVRGLVHHAAIGGLSTFYRHVRKLEARGYIEWIPGDRRKGKSNHYVLKMSVAGTLIETGGKGLDTSTTVPVVDIFTPHLRNPAPATTSAGGDDRDSDLPPEDAIPENVYIFRRKPESIYDEDKAPPIQGHFEREAPLGKSVELALHLLYSWDGVTTVKDLSTATGTNHVSKMRRKLQPLVEAGVIGVDPPGRHGARVWLVEGWEARLDSYRETNGELRRARQQAVRHRKQREAFHGEASKEEATADKATNLQGKEPVRSYVDMEERKRARGKAKEQVRKADVFIGMYARRLGHIRFGLLKQLWRDEGEYDVKILRRTAEARYEVVKLAKGGEDGWLIYPKEGTKESV